MDKILFNVKLSEARAQVTARTGILTSGMSGVKVRFEYDNEWKLLNKTAVFRAGNVIKDVLDIDRDVEIPHEVLLQHGLLLQVGVYGIDESGTLVFPTTWVSLGMITPGTEPSGDESAKPALPIWAQLMNLISSIRSSGIILPAGGKQGQALTKKTDSDFDTEWADVLKGEATEGPPGKDGKDGISATHSWNGTVLTMTSASGTSSADLKGSKGDPGAPGKDGYTPVKGVDYFDGQPGKDGQNGQDGYTPVKGVDYFDGKDGRDGKDGQNGLTPAKGIDYFTPSDVEEIAQQAAEKVNVPEAPVLSVNNKTGNVTLAAADVKARPDNWMPTAQEVGALPSTYTPPNQTAEQVGADPKGTADTAVSQHNTSEDSHNDIRLALKAINDRLTAFFDSDDATLDELSEIVAYITSNKTLIEAITTSKVSVSDIVNNLTTNAANKPLSAAQGVVLKGLIDAVSTSLSGYALKSAIPTKVSQLTNDAGYLTQHQDISGKLDASELPTAINTALAQAAASGEFDGADGRGIKSIARTSGNGAAGTTDTYTITYTDNTTGTLTVYNGKDGTNGTSVTVKSVSESTTDGGNNVVTFSDGKTVTIKNGSKGSKGDKGDTPHIGDNGNWYIGDTDTGKPSVLTASGKIQYVKKDNITDGQFWILNGSNLIKYSYANYSTLEPLTLPAGQYYVSAISAPYSYIVVGNGTPVRFDTYAPESAGTASKDFILTLSETSTLYLGYYTPTQVTATTPYIVSGNEPLADGEYFEGEDSLSLEKLLNYGAFVEAYIKNCELVANELDITDATHGHYTGVKMDAHIAQIMCKARLTANASVALITTDRGSSIVTDITGGSLHLVFSLGGCAVGIFDTAGNLRNVATYSYSVSAGAEVAFGFAINEATNTMTVYLPNGTTKTVTDADVSVRNGQYAVWEHFCNISTAGFEFCKMTKLWCKDTSGNVLDDNLKRLDGAIGVAPTGQVYRQFTTHNRYNHDFK